MSRLVPDHAQSSVRRRRVACGVAGLTLFATLTVAAPTAAQVLLEDHFDTDVASLSGNSGWSTKFCQDGWTTALNGGVIAQTDLGCTCGQAASLACDFAVYTADGNPCYKSQASDNLLIRGDLDWSDYAFDFTFRNADNDTMGVVFRYQNTANYYALWYSRDLGPDLVGACDGSFPGARLVRVAAKSGSGKAVVLAESKTTYQVGAVHKVRVEAQGKALRVYFDANSDGQIDPGTELLFDVQDDVHGHGAVGLTAYQNGAGEAPCNKGGCWFDDVVVQEIGGVAVPVDGDGDGIFDDKDNCVAVANPDQADHDGDGAGDVCDLDVDGDGLDNVTELKLQSQPLDADTDDDGLIDGLEQLPGEDLDGDKIPNILDPDSDGDGLPDGLEFGVAVPHADTDLSTGVFIPDQEPQTTTDPTLSDTDGDGLADGVEDANHNGRIDVCESNPSVPDELPCAGTLDAGGTDAAGGADGEGGRTTGDATSADPDAADSGAVAGGAVADGAALDSSGSAGAGGKPIALTVTKTSGNSGCSVHRAGPAGAAGAAGDAALLLAVGAAIAARRRRGRGAR